MLLFLILALVIGISHAAIPQLISYQGKLVNSTTGDLLTGSYQMNFSIYNASSGGTLLWNESQTVSVDNGITSTYLGSVITLNLPFNDSYWLEIKINNGTGWETLTPRQRLAAAPYAYAAGGWYLTGTTVSLLSSTNNINANTLYVDNSNSCVGINKVACSSSKLYIYDTVDRPAIIINATGGRGLKVYAGETGIQVTVPDGSGFAVKGIGGVWGGYFTTDKENALGVEALSVLTGIYGEATNNDGIGVRGIADNTTGATYGVYGYSNSNSGTGVYGNATNATGTTYGVAGNVSSASGYSGYFEGGKGVYVKSGNINTTGALNVKNGSTGQAIFVNNKEAIWSNDIYFSWGYDNSYNYFADGITIGSTLAPPTSGLRVTGESVMLEKGKNLVPDTDYSNSVLWSGAGAQENVTLPNGQIVNAIKITTSGDVMVYSTKIPMDPEKAYRFSLWIKQDATTGTRYFGFYVYNSTGHSMGVFPNNSAAADTNPYFWSGNLTDNNWHYLVAYVFPSNGPTIWINPLDTYNINFRNNASVTDCVIRFLNYYNYGTTTTAWFALPKIEEIDSDSVPISGDSTTYIQSLAGTVGIGTSDPDSNYKLHVNSTISGIKTESPGATTPLNVITTGTGTVAYFTAGGTWFKFNNTGFYSNGSKSAILTTLRGEEATYYGTESEFVEFTMSGSGQLKEGISKVEFGYPFNESISDKVPVRVFITPITQNAKCGSLYVSEKSINGFTVKRTGNCPEDTKFDWYAIARRINY